MYLSGQRKRAVLAVTTVAVMVAALAPVPTFPSAVANTLSSQSAQRTSPPPSQSVSITESGTWSVTSPAGGCSQMGKPYSAPRLAFGSSSITLRWAASVTVPDWWHANPSEKPTPYWHFSTVAGQISYDPEPLPGPCVGPYTQPPLVKACTSPITERSGWETRGDDEVSIFGSQNPNDQDFQIQPVWPWGDANQAMTAGTQTGTPGPCDLIVNGSASNPAETVRADLAGSSLPNLRAQEANWLAQYSKAETIKAQDDHFTPNAINFAPVNASFPSPLGKGANDTESATETMTISGTPGCPVSPSTVAAAAASGADAQFAYSSSAYGNSPASENQICGGYVALGDSFASGEGNPPFSGGDCDRSESGYPQLVQNIFHFSQFTFEACSGARIADLLDQVDNVPMEERLKAEAVTITIGGNDVNFEQIIRLCAEAHILHHLSCTGDHAFHGGIYPLLGSGTSKLARQFPGVFRNLLFLFPVAKIIVLGYPEIFPEFSGNDCSHLLVYGLPTPAGVFDREDIPELHKAVVALNGRLNLYVKALRSSRVVFVNPNLDNAFLGHDSCSSQSWFTGIFWGRDEVFSLHPNANGQHALAGAVIHQLVRDGVFTG